MQDYGFWSLVPPILAIFLAIRTRQVVFSLFVGIFFGYVVISQWNPFLGFLKTIESVTNVFQSKGNTNIIILTLVIGALIRLITYSGGINGFILWVQKKLDNSSNPQKKIQIGAALVGFLIFVESNISILTVGTIFRPLFDKYKIPREKLAYIADSSSAPACILFPLNAWGAYILGLLASYENIEPFKMLIYAIPFNFYAIFTLIMVFFIVISGKDFALMKKIIRLNNIVKSNEKTEKITRKSPVFNMVIPILVMVLSMPAFLVYSGWSDELTGSLGQKIWVSIGNGSGSQSVLNACVSALIIAVILYGYQKLISLETFFKESYKGMNEMLVMAILMVVAFALGSLCNELGTGIYISKITKVWLVPEVAPALIFIISAFIAFSTGTSWGTFAIMISIALPMSEVIHANNFLMLAAVLGGGVFGDHCSPISDTTLVASVASKCEHIDHVKTQLPYAFFTGGLSFIAYLVAGFIF